MHVVEIFHIHHLLTQSIHLHLPHCLQTEEREREKGRHTQTGRPGKIGDSRSCHTVFVVYVVLLEPTCYYRNAPAEKMNGKRARNAAALSRHEGRSSLRVCDLGDETR